jgi:hypothetical protein
LAVPTSSSSTQLLLPGEAGIFFTETVTSFGLYQGGEYGCDAATKRPAGYVFAHVEGAARPTVNGKPLVTETLQLHDGDVVELAGTQMQFINR